MILRGVLLTIFLGVITGFGHVSASFVNQIGAAVFVITTGIVQKRVTKTQLAYLGAGTLSGEHRG